LRLKEVCVQVGLKSLGIYRLVKLGRFPTQVKLSERSVACIESEVEVFTEARIAERDRGPAPVLPVPPHAHGRGHAGDGS
jgi:prophage regulatory protein